MADNEDVARRSLRLRERAQRDEGKYDADLADPPQQVEQDNGEHLAADLPDNRVPDADPEPAAVPDEDDLRMLSAKYVKILLLEVTKSLADQGFAQGVAMERSRAALAANPVSPAPAVNPVSRKPLLTNKDFPIKLVKSNYKGWWRQLQMAFDEPDGWRAILTCSKKDSKSFAALPDDQVRRARRLILESMDPVYRERFAPRESDWDTCRPETILRRVHNVHAPSGMQESIRLERQLHELLLEKCDDVQALISGKNG